MMNRSAQMNRPAAGNPCAANEKNYFALTDAGAFFCALRFCFYRRC